MSQRQVCLADGGKHRWKYTTVGDVRTTRECLKCGTTSRNEDGKWRPSGSTRWVPLTPEERATSVRVGGVA